MVRNELPGSGDALLSTQPGHHVALMHALPLPLRQPKTAIQTAPKLKWQKSECIRVTTTEELQVAQLRAGLAAAYTCGGLFE